MSVIPERRTNQLRGDAPPTGRSHVRRFLPHQAPAPLCHRRSERDASGSARGRARTSSISAWAIRTCRRRRMSSTSCAKWRASPMRTAIRRRRASPGCARPRPAITSGASASISNPDTEVVVTLGLEGRARQPRPGDHGARRRRARAEPELSRSTRSASSLRAPRSAACRPRPTSIISRRWSGPWPSPCRGRACW